MALIAGVVIAYVISVFSAISLIRNIIPPLNRAIRITERISQGDLTQEVSGEIMNRVVNSIQDVNAVMGEITSASHEQAEGIEQVNIAVTRMDHATQQHAALVEEAAAAAQTLSENAESLKKMVGIFQLPENGRQPSTQPLLLS